MTPTTLPSRVPLRFLECATCGQMFATLPAITRHKDETGCGWAGTPGEGQAFLDGQPHHRAEPAW